MRENLRYVIQYHAHTIRILVRIVAQTAKSASFACRFSLNIRQFSLTPAKMEMPMSTTWFVGADWLAEHIDDPEIQIIDARMASPGQEDRNVAQEYLNGHIPGAVFFDIEALSDHTSPLPHMLPRPETFAVAMRELGVNQDKHLIVYDEGNLFSAPRAWWMLRTFGVEKVSILGGGLAGWQRDVLLLEEGAVELPEGEFNATFNPEAVVKVTDVLLASHENTAQIIDARPAARFNAEVDEPRPGLRRGHIPGALNVPWTELVREGELKTTDELDAIFFGRGVSYDKPIIVSCGSGVTAAVVLLALATLDVPNVKLYDGAWSEWGARADLPVEPLK
ncbi:3-mercaptopyruvate sulfurtransferase [Escherichia coli LAU-EC8]|jgi:thiosulfate/3-mercaptopyruvate sulfurtransferase|nr:3-mercaptopyruvate sulfurtransferase [Escherichia coli LAU-EC8]ETE34360.1 3-mercaptopyruvate sulfurtransferase [Escherichia coli LAU-EC9]